MKLCTVTTEAIAVQNTSNNIMVNKVRGSICSSVYDVVVSFKVILMAVLRVAVKM